MRLARVVALFAAVIASLALVPGARADSLDPPVLATPEAGSSIKVNPSFTWAPVSRAAKYRVQVSTTAAFSQINYTADVRGTTATPISELPLGTLHWRVATIDHTGNQGTFSAAQTFTRVQADAPELTSPGIGSTLLYPADPAVLSWKAIDGIKQYKIEIDDEATFTNPSSHTTAGTNLALPLALPSNAARFWRVQGISSDQAVTTAWSDAQDLRSFKIAWPAATKPTPLTPADDISTAIDDIEFSWTPVPGAAKYQVQISTSENFNANVTTQTTAATRFRQTSVLTQDQYYWHVRALQANGEPTEWSTTSRFKREWLDLDGLPARPAITITDADGLTGGTQLDQDKIAVSWTPVRGAAYYELSISTDPTFTATPSTSSAVHRVCKTPNNQWTPYISGVYTGTSAGFGPCDFTDVPASGGFIKPGIPYYVRVRAIDQSPDSGVRTSLWSNLAREGDVTAPDTSSFTTVATVRDGTNASAYGTPAELLSSPDSAGTPKLTWKPVQGAKAYLVAMSRDSSFNSRVLDNSVVTTNTEFVLNQALLDNSVGQPYFWFVLPCSTWSRQGPNTCVAESQAINIANQFKTYNKLGKAVTGLAGNATQTDTVKLSWQDQLQTSSDGGGVKWYEVEVRDSSNVVVDNVKTDSNGYTPIDEAYPDGAYSWQVRAIDATGTALAWSAPANFDKRSSTPVPVAPANTGTLPVLTWTPTSFAGAYDVEVYRGTDAAFPAGSKVPSAGATGRKYPASTPASALPADTYSWRVRQGDAYGNPGPWSTQVLPFTIGGTPPALQTPANAAAAPLPSLVFKWSKVPGAVKYRFESSTTPGFGTTTESVLTTESAWAPTGPYLGGTTYYWRVSALNANDDVLATSPAREFVAKTHPLTPAAQAATIAGKINLTWAEPDTGGSPVTKYILRYRVFGATTWTEYERAGDVLAAQLDGLPADTKYELQVAAVNAIGVGPFSTIVSATTPGVPKAAMGLTLTPEAGGFTVKWTPPSSTAADLPVKDYVVRYVPTAGGTQQEVTVATAEAVLTGLAGLTQYNVEVAAENDYGRGPFISSTGTTKAAPVASPTPAPSSTATASPTPSASPAATATATASSSPAPTSTATSTATATPTASPDASPSPSPSPSAEPAASCKVPKLKGKTKKAAKKALVNAHCKPGKISGKGRRVKGQFPRAGAVREAGSKVLIFLGKS